MEHLTTFLRDQPNSSGGRGPSARAADLVPVVETAVPPGARDSAPLEIPAPLVSCPTASAGSGWPTVAAPIASTTAGACGSPRAHLSQLRSNSARIRNTRRKTRASSRSARPWACASSAQADGSRTPRIILTVPFTALRPSPQGRTRASTVSKAPSYPADPTDQATPAPPPTHTHRLMQRLGGGWGRPV